MVEDDQWPMAIPAMERFNLVQMYSYQCTINLQRSCVRYTSIAPLPSQITHTQTQKELKLDNEESHESIVTIIIYQRYETNVGHPAVRRRTHLNFITLGNLKPSMVLKSDPIWHRLCVYGTDNCVYQQVFIIITLWATRILCYRNKNNHYRSHCCWRDRTDADKSFRQRQPHRKQNYLAC